VKFYIAGPKDGGDGVYTLLHESGEGLASHFCSHLGFAPGDLILNRKERKEKWAAEFGPLDPLEVIWMGNLSQEEIDEIGRLNEECHQRYLAEHPEETQDQGTNEVSPSTEEARHE
jgi:hypothetical protein